MLGLELRRSPDRERVVGEANVDAARHLEQFPVGVAANEDCPVTERPETVENLRRLRTPGVVSGDDDQFSVGDRGLGEDVLQRGQHSVNVGEHRNCRDHTSTMPRASAHAARRHGTDRPRTGLVTSCNRVCRRYDEGPFPPPPYRQQLRSKSG